MYSRLLLRLFRCCFFTVVGGKPRFIETWRFMNVFYQCLLCHVCTAFIHLPYHRCILETFSVQLMYVLWIVFAIHLHSYVLKRHGVCRVWQIRSLVVLFAYIISKSRTCQLKWGCVIVVHIRIFHVFFITISITSHSAILKGVQTSILSPSFSLKTVSRFSWNSCQSCLENCSLAVYEKGVTIFLGNWWSSDEKYFQS